MFVLSLQQFLKLMKVNEKWHKGSLLDLGAGDGEVTAHLSALFDKTYVTEVSTTMRNLLQNRGYKYIFPPFFFLDVSTAIKRLHRLNNVILLHPR